MRRCASMWWPRRRSRSARRAARSIGPTTTIFYDSGFLIGLKGFVAAVFAGLSSYPLALVGALGVGLLESFGSFWASSFKEVIVFSAILPVLLWRSLRDPHPEEH